MSPGDLVVVKKGFPSEGQVGVVKPWVDQVGVVLTVAAVADRAFCDVLFPEGVKNLHRWWLEPLEVPDASR